MKSAFRRRGRRPSLERLEGRALLANAGAVDPTFGSLGESSLPFIPRSGYPQYDQVGTPSVVEPDGKILLSGTYDTAGLGPDAFDFVIERLDADGSPDPTFGANGVASVPVAVNIYPRVVAALVAQPNGSIIEAATFYPVNSNFGTTLVIRVNSNGTLDTSYGVDGVVTLPATIGSLKIQGVSGGVLTAGDQLVLSGTATDPSSTSVEDFFAVRLNTDGSIDTSFGSSGFANVAVPTVPNLGYPGGYPEEIALRPGGGIVLVGELLADTTNVSSIGPSYEGVVIALTSSGEPDATFGGSANGVVVLTPDPTKATTAGRLAPVGLAVQANGEIVVSATGFLGTAAPSTSYGRLIRLTAAGVLDPTFGQGGVVFSTGSLSPAGVAIEPDGKIIVPGSVGNLPAAGQYDSDGAPDLTFGDLATPGVQTYPLEVEVGSPENGISSGASFDSAGRLILTGAADSESPGGVSPTGFPFPAIRSFVAIRAFLTPTLTPAVDQPPADLLGTGQTDLSVYVPGSGVLASIPMGATSDQLDAFGSAGAGQTIPAVGDYDKLGHAQIAVYLPSIGVYAIQATSTTPAYAIQLGVPGVGQTIPAPGDYYGTGQDDVAVYIPAQGVWAIKDPTGQTPGFTVHLGIPGLGQSIPVPADYFGTGQDDIAVYLTKSATFAIINPATQQVMLIPFGVPGIGQSIPVPGDYDDSGKIELAVFIPSKAEFIYRPADGGPDVIEQMGIAGDNEIPVPGDYDGSGQDEFAVDDPVHGFIAYRPASGAKDVIISFGGPNSGAVPVAANPGSLPEFAGTGPGLSFKAASIEPASVPSASTAQAANSTVAIASSKAVVPAGPTLATARFKLSPVNQAADDPSKPAV